jgi:hypothetical protein
MTDTAVHPPQAIADDGIDEEALTTGETGSVSFAELVRIHYAWERAFSGGRPDEQLEAEFRRKLEEFQECEGTLLHAYWSRRRPSAVALTARARRFKGWRLRGWKLERGRFRQPVDERTEPDAVVRLHRATDWLAREAPIANLLHHCDTLAIRVGEVLRGTSERIAMEWIFAVQSHLLGFIERTQGKASPEEIKAITDTQRQELIEIERYYARAGDRSGRVVYFAGMMVGALISALVAGALALAFWLTGWFTDPYLDHFETFFVSYAAGGIGAIVSVMSRMATENKFSVDYEVGRPTVRKLGAFRPFIGAVFGVAVYFLISSGLPQVTLPADEKAFFYYGTVAFLAGFFERRTVVTFGTAEQTLQRSLGLTPTDDGPSPDLAQNGGGAGGEIGRSVTTRRVERTETIS